MKAHVLFMAATAAMLSSIGAIAAEAPAEKDGWPFIVIRHTRYLNESPETFAKLIDCHRRHPGVCDEFWFSTGARKTVDEIRAVAETIASFRPLCDETGIKLSVQQAVSLGHSSNWMDGDTAKFPESAMQQDRNGKLLRNILCPRAPEALAYEREVVKTVLSVAKPYSYWLDDDLRMGMRSMPNGCFCPRCVKAFNEETNGAWTREALAAAVFDKPGNQPVRAAWSEFNARSLATFAATVRRAADEIRSPCRLAVQTTVSDTLWCGKDFRPTLEALSGPAHQSVGIRPGGGFYVEAEPRRMIEKSLFIVREAERCRDFGGLVGTVCYEEDNYPWRMLHKSPGAIMTEAALALASGCDSLSLYWYSHAAPEPIEEYDRFLRTLAKARPYFERLAASTRRTRLGGVARFVGSAAGESKEFCLRSHFDYDLACAGIPVTVPESGTKVWYVTEKSRSEMTEADRATVAGHVVDIADIGKYPLASRRAKLLDDLDKVTGGTFPVRVDACRPLRILPRVRPDGKVDSVTLLNLSIGDTDELAVRVRNPVTERAVLHDAKGGAPQPLAMKPGKVPNERIVLLDNIPGWQIVTIFFEPPAASVRATTAHLYPQPNGEARNAAGYAVTVDGQPAGVAAVRNSAMPVNIRWPGHQRELDQTEIDGMVRFSTAGKAVIAVTAPRDFKEVKVRPYAKGVKAEVAGRTATFTIPGPGAYSVEFDGPHENLHVFADPPETLKAKPGDKGVRYFGPGEHDVGLITLKTGETLYIDEGAVVFGRVEARDADHIRILGRGILDMSRIKEQPVAIDPKLAEEQRKRGFAITNAKRWNAMKLEFCDDVLIDGITIRDSLLYNIRPIGCRGLTIRNVKICGNWRYNSDGIDMHNCENVRISDCFVRTFDDAICVKGFDYTMDESEMLHDGYHHNVFTNVVVERCTVWCDWGHCLEFGAETRAEEIRDVTWRDCDILHVHSAPLDVKNCDYADIHDVLYENIRLEMDRPCAKTCLAASAKSFNPQAFVGQPPAFSSAVRVIAEYSKNDKRRGKNHDIRLKNIRVTSPQMPRFTSSGYDAEHRSTEITVDGIHWNGREVSKEAAKGQSVGPFADPIRFCR
jgi:hypothetical protein